MQRAGGVALFPEGRDERMRRLPSSRGCTARLCFGPKPGGTFESETITAGLAPDGVYVYDERGEGRRNRPLSQGEHGCPKQSRTLEGKPAQASNSMPAFNAKPKHAGRFDASDLPRFSDRRRTRFYGTICALSGIELRGDGGTNGSHESRGLKLAESC